MKSVLITGASRGIGRELALAFANAGYAVGINYHKEKAKAETVLKELSKAGHQEAALFECDVRDSLKVRQMMQSVLTRWKRLDVLVNNSGITRDRTVLKMTNGEWNDVIDTNLSGVFWCLREAARVMSEEKKGSIVNIASIMALRPGFGNANYSAAKAGVIALTKGAARELGRFQVRVNAVLPGFHRTDMSQALTEENHKRVLSEHVLGRSTTMADLSRMVIGIAENESISGQVFNIDSRIC
jgi:3-oxoacyl-[acyl-carrier protein] reductase